MSCGIRWCRSPSTTCIELRQSGLITHCRRDRTRSLKQDQSFQAMHCQHVHYQSDFDLFSPGRRTPVIGEGPRLHLNSRHTALGRSECIANAEATYLVELTLPADGTVCSQ